MNLCLKKSIEILTVMAVCSACATAPVVSTRVADGIHLEQYKTYALETGPVQNVQGQVMPGNQTEIGRLLEKLVRDQLEQRGLKPVDRNADLTFLYAAARRERQWVDKKWPYEDHYWPYQEGAADIIACDRLDHVVWAAHMQAVIEPKDTDHNQLRKAIVKAFRKYPTISQVGS